MQYAVFIVSWNTNNHHNTLVNNTTVKSGQPFHDVHLKIHNKKRPTKKESLTSAFPEFFEGFRGPEIDYNAC